MSNIEQQIITGPSVQKVASATEAEDMLRKTPGFPNGAQVKLTNLNGHWIAAIAKIAGPPFGDEGGEPGGGSEPPEPAGPPSDSGESESEPKPDEGGEEKPKKDKEKGHGGEEHLITQIFDMLSTLTQALGIAGPDAGMMPGMDDPAAGGPPMPPGAGGPPGMPPGGPGGDGKTHTVHERALKPGEAPPGTTPVGAPTFASVDPRHPWAEHIAAGTKQIDLEDDLGNDTIATVADELRSLGAPHGYKIDSIVPFERDGHKKVAARMVRR